MMLQNIKIDNWMTWVFHGMVAVIFQILIALGFNLFFGIAMFTALIIGGLCGVVFYYSAESMQEKYRLMKLTGETHYQLTLKGYNPFTWQSYDAKMDVLVPLVFCVAICFGYLFFF